MDSSAIEKMVDETIMCSECGGDKLFTKKE
jgi:hypothetical protein